MTNVYVFDADTNTPIEGATVTCTGMPSQETGADGYASFDTAPFTYYTFTANADHYLEPSSQYVMGADPYIEFGLHRKIVTHALITIFLYNSGEWMLDNATITVTDSETGGAIYNESCTSYYISYLYNYGCLFELGEGVEYIARAEKTGYHTFTTTFTAEDYGDTTLALLPRLPTVVTEEASIIKDTTTQLNGLLTDLDGLASVGFHFHYWGGGLDEYTHIGHPTGPSSHASLITGLQPDTLYSYQAIGINDSDVFELYSYGEVKQFTTLAELTHNMQLVFPNPYGLLFVDHTIIACDDPAQACTLFTFQIKNNGDVAMGAWYKVSVVGGATLYESTIPPLDPSVTSAAIDDYVCAIPPGGLPVGTHTIKVEVGPEGEAATDSYTVDIFVIEQIEPPSGVILESLHYETRCGAEIADNCIWFYCSVEHFGGDSTCTVYAEYKSEGDLEWSQTDPTVVPYDPEYAEGGFQLGPITICIPNCEVNHYIRTVASNNAGTAYSATQTPITVRLEAPTEITQTSAKLNAYIVSMGSVSSGIANFGYGRPGLISYDLPHIPISSAGAFSRTITGLVPNTTYQYNLFARAPSPQAYPQTVSTTVSFTTLPESFDITFVATAPGISDLHNVDVTDTTDPLNHIYLGKT